jgi:hypothetical protein
LISRSIVPLIPGAKPELAHQAGDVGGVAAGRIFGLVVCSFALVVQVADLRGTLAVYKSLTGPEVKFLTSSEVEWPGLLFWLLPPANVVLFLVGIILIARWRPLRLPS